MKKYEDYPFKKGTNMVIRNINSTNWKDFVATKDNVFTSFQMCIHILDVFPHEDYITFRFHNWFAAVRKTDLTIG